MAIQGLIGTGDFGADERPKNWRQGVLMRFPNGHAPLVALSGQMKTKVTDDPEFNWWERQMSDQRIQSAEDMDATETTMTIAADPFGHGGWQQLREGHLLYVEETGEIMRVSANPTGNDVAVTRNFTGDKVNGTAFAALTGTGVNPNLIIIGNANEEGTTHPQSIRYRATKLFNYTQIFRDSLKATRTAMKTRLRTLEEVRDAKRQCLLYHTIGMEWATFFGKRSEGTGADGEPERTTGGIVDLIPASNRFDNGGTDLDLETLEEHLLAMFRFGSKEKMAFAGMRALLGIQQVIRKNSSYEIGPSTKEFGLDIRRIFTPFGTLVMKVHPLFQQIQGGTAPGTGAFFSLDNWLIALDMANLVWRPLTDSDTKYLPDRQPNGMDGMESEYLTEGGFEISHGITHYVITGINKGVADT